MLFAAVISDLFTAIARPRETSCSMPSPIYSRAILFCAMARPILAAQCRCVAMLLQLIALPMPLSAIRCWPHLCLCAASVAIGFYAIACPRGSDRYSTFAIGDSQNRDLGVMICHCRASEFYSMPMRVRACPCQCVSASPLSLSLPAHSRLLLANARPLGAVDWFTMP